MASESEFRPQWTSAPGHTIADALAARSISRAEFAERLGQSASFVDGLLDGYEAITIGLARQLQELVGGSAAFWMTRDRQYRADVARLRETGLGWLQELPLNDMARFGWIAEQLATGLEVETLLRYFDVPSVAVWHAQYASLFQATAFRTSPTFQSRPEAVAAWLRQGERIADTIPCAPWDPEAFRRALKGLRTLTRVRDPQRFIPKLRETTASCGVSVAIVPAPSGCRASGAIRWLSQEKALVMLSARHLADDHLWFTFYHECGHLLLHRETKLFLDEEVNDITEASAAQEEEANSFAAETLIPAEYRDALRYVPPNAIDVIRLAGQIGVAPGILVGQLQNLKRVGPERLNGLKRRYEWDGNRLIIRQKT